jgi:hypothetical protein
MQWILVPSSSMPSCSMTSNMMALRFAAFFEKPRQPLSVHVVCMLPGVLVAKSSQLRQPGRGGGVSYKAYPMNAL